jgi:hypothetical protein
MLKHFFFEVFFVVWKYNMIFLALRDLGVCMKQKHFFSMFWRKPGILILDLYLYGIKIETTIKQNSIKNTQENYKFSKIFLATGPDPAQPFLGWASDLVNNYHTCPTRHDDRPPSRCIVSVARPCAASVGDFCLFACLVLWVLGSRHLVFDSGLLGNPDVLVFVRDSRVRD